MKSKFNKIISSWDFVRIEGDIAESLNEFLFRNTLSLKQATALLWYEKTDTVRKYTTGERECPIWLKKRLELLMTIEKNDGFEAVIELAKQEKVWVE